MQDFASVKAVAAPDSALYEHILASVSDGIHVVGLDGKVLVENRASAQMLGWCGDCLVGRNGHTAIHHHHADGRLFPTEECPIYQTLQDGQPREVLDDCFWRQDGSRFPVEYRTSPLRDLDGRIYGATVVFRDITERRIAERMQAALYGLSTSSHGCDSASALFPRIERILAEVVPLHRLYVSLLDGGDAQLRCSYLGEGRKPSHKPLQRACNERAWHVVHGSGPCHSAEDDDLQWIGAPVRMGNQVIGAMVMEHVGERAYTNADGQLLQFAADQLASALERTRREEKLRYQAQYDPLTNLPNRNLFADRLNVALGQSERRREGLALVNIDLDQFKPVNDQFGHAVGDELLRHVANRLKHALRASDTVARVGGDEFVALLLQPTPRSADMLVVAEKMRAALAHPFELKSTKVQISASIGVALYPQHGSDAETLLRNADAAMYRAKRAGSNRVELA